MFTRRITRPFLLTVVLLLVVSTLLACSQAPSLSGSKASESKPAGAPQKPAAAAPPAAEGARSGAPSASQSANESADRAAAPWDRMIIRTAQLTLTVENVEETLAAARRVANQAGGFVSQSETRFEGERMLATLTLQVPAAQFDAVVQELRGLAVKVESERSSSQDVTEEYVDLQAQLTNLEATEARLRSVLEQATRVEDILSIQREITQVRNQIERIKGRMNYLQKRTDFSSITLTLMPPGVTPKGVDGAWDPLETIERAWAASLRLLRGFAEVVLTVVVFFWWLLPLAVLLWPLWRAVLARRRAHSASQS